MQDNQYIVNFKNQFTKKFREQVIPIIKDMDTEREKLLTKNEALKKKIYIIAAVIIFAIFMYEFIVEHCISIMNNGYIFTVGGAIALTKGLKYVAKKSFEKSIKQKIMPVLMSAFGDFQWTTSCTISQDEIKKSKLFKYYERYETDDNFSGSYRGVNVRIAEAELTYTVDSSKGERTVVEFDGVLISINIPKSIVGHTMVLDKKDKRQQFLSEYKEVKLEDVEFSKMFNVYSTDQVESRYLLTTAFMERFKNIRNVFGGDLISCSFLDKTLLIAIPVDKDMFSLGDLDVSILDTEQYNVFLNEIISIFELIEELKLYQNTGL